MVTNQSGEITPPGAEGVYASDTRFISVYRLYINRQPWELVNSSQLSFYASRIRLTNPRIPTEDGDLNEHTISLTLERTVGEGIHEDYYIDNYAGKKIRIVLELALRSDFADIFEVKAKRFVQRGRVQSRWNEKDGHLRTTYTDSDFHRAVTYQPMDSDSLPCFANGRISFEIELEHGHDWRDAQPGKILNEVRFGELAHFHKIPFTPYYGTADATVLYLLVLCETYRWTGDVHLLKEYHMAAERCLSWIDQYGDLDGDGFQEYRTYSSLGYENVGWKDSWDAVVYADGSQVKQPKGLCELQGYVYDAKVRMAEMFEVLGNAARARTLRQQAEELKRKFNDAFWMEAEGCFAYGLDFEKKQITAVASNAGHCLWSGIADQDKAERTARRLLQDDMWSGWGIRTISSKNPAFNPFSYHLGSVWPHDNGIIAAGFKRYGLPQEANQVIRGVFDAARRFEAYRLPEIYAGLKRESRTTDFPALYPGGANIPQGCAVRSGFQMLQTILGLRADAPHKRIYVNPTLPEWLPELQIQRLEVGHCRIDLRFWRDGDRSRWEVSKLTADEGAAQGDMIQVLDEVGSNDQVQ